MFSKELCDPNNNITMCPLCDVQCPYWQLHEACTHAAASRIFDNGATVFFAIFMSLWGRPLSFVVVIHTYMQQFRNAWRLVIF